MGVFQPDECSKSTPEQQPLYKTSKSDAINKLRKEKAPRKIHRYLKVYSSRLIILYKHVEPLLKKLEPIFTDQNQQLSNVPQEKMLNSLVVDLELEMRVYFRPLRALIEQDQEHKRFPKFKADIAEFDEALNAFEDLMSRPPLNRIPNVSDLCANTSTELVWRCFLLLRQFDTNTKPSAMISYLQEIFKNATSNMKRQFIVLPATTHLAWDKDKGVIYLSSTAVKWNYIFPHQLEKQTRSSRIQDPNISSLNTLRETYTEELEIHRGLEFGSTSELILKSHHIRWKSGQKEDGTHFGGLYFEGIVGAALDTFYMKRRDPCHLDKATLQFEYLLRNDEEYSFHEGNAMDWPVDTCAEVETALKLIRSHPELKGMLDNSLAWAGARLHGLQSTA